MTRFLTLAAALVGLGLILAPLAEAGGGNRGEDRRNRSAGGNRAPAPRIAAPRPQPSRSAPSRGFTRSSPAPSFKTRSQPVFRQPVTSTSGVSRGIRRNGPQVRAPSQPAPVRPAGVSTWNRSSPTWTRSAPSSSALRDRAQRGRGQPAIQRMRTRAPTSTALPATRGAVATGGRNASPSGDTTPSFLGNRSRRNRGGSTSLLGNGLRAGAPTARTPTAGAPTTARVRSGTGLGAVTQRNRGVGTSSALSSRFGTRRTTSGFAPRSGRFGGASTSAALRSGRASSSAALRSGGIGTRSATGGSVSTRFGTRSGRIGRSYRIHSGYASRHHHHAPLFGFYYAWSPYRVPYYNVYPSYGLYFGYGLSYYGPSYSTVFVDAVDYYPSEVIVREEIIEEEIIEPAPAVAPPANGGFPAPAPQAGGPEAADGTEAQPERAPHPDFEPAVQDFLAGRYQQALERLDRVIMAEPDNGEAWLAALHANFALGRYGRAGAALAEAAALDAFPRGYRFDPRPLYAKTGNFDRAVKALESHVAKNPQDADAVLLRAYIHVSLGERGEAQDLIQRALEIRPADETAPALALALLPPPPPPQPAK